MRQDKLHSNYQTGPLQCQLLPSLEMDHRAMKCYVIGCCILLWPFPSLPLSCTTVCSCVMYLLLLWKPWFSDLKLLVGHGFHGNGIHCKLSGDVLMIRISTLVCCTIVTLLFFLFCLYFITVHVLYSAIVSTLQESRHWSVCAVLVSSSCCVGWQPSGSRR